MDDKTKAESEKRDAQQRRHELIMTLYPEMTKLGRTAPAIIQDAILFDKYIQTGERP